MEFLVELERKNKEHGIQNVLDMAIDVKTWTNEETIANYDMLRNDIIRLNAEKDAHEKRCRCENMHEHVWVCSSRKIKLDEAKGKMKVVLEHAKKIGIPGDRSEGNAMCSDM